MSGDQSPPVIRVNVPYEQVAEFCQRNHIRQLALFGSVLRSDFEVQSDIDVLVEFQPGQTPDFFELYRMEQELSVLLGGRDIDLVTPQALNKYLRDAVLSSALTIYAQN